MPALASVLCGGCPAVCGGSPVTDQVSRLMLWSVMPSRTTSTTLLQLVAVASLHCVTSLPLGPGPIPRYMTGYWSLTRGWVWPDEGRVGVTEFSSTVVLCVAPCDVSPPGKRVMLIGMMWCAGDIVITVITVKAVVSDTQLPLLVPGIKIGLNRCQVHFLHHVHLLVACTAKHCKG